MANPSDAIGVDRMFAAGHNNLGLALRELGLIAGAEESQRRALALNPAFAVSLNNLGNVLRAQGHMEGAVAAFRRATPVKPDHADAHNNLGNALMDRWRQVVPAGSMLEVRHEDLAEDLERARAGCWTTAHCLGTSAALLFMRPGSW